MIWWIDNPLLMENFKKEIKDFPYLNLCVDNQIVSLQGDWPVYGEKRLITTYKIKIDIPNDFPKSTPKVYEIGGAIEKNPERHFNKEDNSACLFIVTEQQEHWPLGSSISLFLNKPVKEFFFSQAYYDLTGEWPFGFWAHGEKGLIDYCMEYLNLRTKSQLKKFFNYIYLKKPHKIECPCGNKKLFRDCHFDKFNTLIQRRKISDWRVFQININKK